jgi:hypothetical protein
MIRSTVLLLAACAAVGCSDASSKVTPPPAGDGGLRGDGCVPRGCAGLNKSCGLVDDGCGGQVPCGACTWVSDQAADNVEGAAAVILAGVRPIPHVAFSADGALKLAVRGASRPVR